MKVQLWYTIEQRKKLETALKRARKCGGDCKHCEKCHIYISWTEKAGYMAVGCDLLPQELFTDLADGPSKLHAEVLETLHDELEWDSVMRSWMA
jgi:hypothetical protein